MLRGENDHRFDRRLKRNPAGIVSELTCEEAETNVRFYACSLTPGRADSSFYTVGEDDNNEVGPPSQSLRVPTPCSAKFSQVVVPPRGTVHSNALGSSKKPPLLHLPPPSHIWYVYKLEEKRF